MSHLDQIVKPHVGRAEKIPIDERLQVADGFSDLVDELILSHMGHVDTTNYEKYPSHTSLQMTYPLGNDRRIHIVINSNQTEQNAIIYEKRICLRETDPKNRTHRLHEYSLNPDRGTDVIRMDIHNRIIDDPETTDEDWLYDEFDDLEDYDGFDDIDETPEQARERDEKMKASEQFLELASRALFHKEFAIQTGTNHQPIDADELAKLRDIVTSADFIHS